MKYNKLLILVVGVLLCFGSLSFSSVVEQAEAGEEQDEFTLNISSTDGGSVFEPGEGTFTFEEGEEISLKALPWDTVYGSEPVDEADYRFERWSGDNETIKNTDSAETTITIEENHSITAEFLPRFDLYSYNLTIDIDGEGSTDPSDEEHVFYFTEEDGDEVTIEADPDDGWEFDEWEGDYNSTSEIISFTLDEDKEITANFQEEEEDEPWMWIIGVGVFAVIVIAIALDAKKDDDEG